MYFNNKELQSTYLLAEENAQQQRDLNNQEYFGMDNNILEIRDFRDNSLVHQLLHYHEDMHLRKIPTRYLAAKTKKVGIKCYTNCQILSLYISLPIFILYNLFYIQIYSIIFAVLLKCVLNIN